MNEISNLIDFVLVQYKLIQYIVGTDMQISVF